MSKRKSKNRMYRDIQFEKIAKESNLSYSYKDEFGLVNLLKDFSLFRGFSSNSITNILEDKTKLYESNFHVFDYEYRLWNGETDEIFTQTVFFAQSKELSLPHFYLEPGRFFKQFGKSSEWEAINLNAFPPSIAEFWLKGKSVGHEQKIMPDDLLDYFAVEKDWIIEGVNYFIILYKKEKTIPTTDLMELFQRGKDLVEVFSKV